MTIDAQDERHAEDNTSHNPHLCLECALKGTAPAIRQENIKNMFCAAQELSIDLKEEVSVTVIAFVIEPSNKCLLPEIITKYIIPFFLDLLKTTLTAEYRSDKGEQIALDFTTGIMRFLQLDRDMVSHEHLSKWYIELRNHNIVEIASNILENDDRPPLQLLAVDVLNSVLASVPLLPMSELKLLTRATISMARITIDDLYARIDIFAQCWEATPPDLVVIDAESKLEDHLDKLLGRWGLRVFYAISLLDGLLNSPLCRIKPTDALELLRFMEEFDGITTLMDVMAENISFKAYFNRTLAATHARSCIITLFNPPNTPASFLYRRSPSEDVQWEAAMQSLDILRARPSYLKQLKRLWFVQRRRTIADIQTEYNLSKNTNEITVTDFTFHPIISEKHFARQIMTGIFRLVLNMVNRAVENNEPIFNFLPFLPMAYQCLSKPTEEDKRTRAASDWRVDTPSCTLTFNREYNQQSAGTYVGCMAVLAPALSMTMINWFLQAQNYQSFTEADRDGTTGTLFNNLSDQELANLRNLADINYVRAIYKRVTHTLAGEQNDSSNNASPFGRIGIRHQYIELGSLILVFGRSINQVDYSCSCHLDPSFFYACHLRDLIYYAIDYERLSPASFEEFADPQRAHRILDEVRAKLATEFSMEPKSRETTMMLEHIYSVQLPLWEQVVRNPEPSVNAAKQNCKKKKKKKKKRKAQNIDVHGIASAATDDGLEASAEKLATS